MNDISLNNNSIRPNIRFNSVMICLLAITYISPLIGSYLPFAVRLLFFIIWTISASSIDRGAFNFKNKIFKVWSLLFIWQLIMLIIGHINTSPKEIVAKFCIYYFPLMFSFVVRNYSFKELRHLFIGFLLIMLYMLVDNIRIGESNAEIFEDIYHGYGGPMTNAGRTSFVAMCMFYTGTCYLLFRSKITKILRFVCALSMVMSGYYILYINSRTTTSLLFLVLMAGLLSIPFFSRWKHGNRAFISFIIFAVAISLLDFGGFMSWLTGLFAGDERMNYRMQGLNDMATYGLQDSTFSGRFGLAMMSLSTWLNNIWSFLFGVGEVTTQEEAFMNGIGNHSEFIDFLGEYGIAGFYFMVVAFSSTIKFIYELFQEVYYKYAVAIIMVVLIIYSVFNKSMVEEMFCMMFLIIPVFLLYASQSKSTI